MRPTVFLTMGFIPFALFNSITFADAAALRTSTLGCKAPADLSRVAVLKQKKDTAGLAALTASGACIPFAKGITLDVDETRMPLSCVRLTGDLTCYWVQDVLVDQFPSEKSGAGGRARRGGHRL